MKAPEIVAELSANHLGRLEKALELVDAAANAGANSIKVQCWTRDMMVSKRDHLLANGPWAGQKLYDLYQQAWTPWSWIPTIFERARQLNLQCIASVFDKPSLGYLELIGCPRYKIASFELVDIPLIEAVRETGKPIILSTGMASEVEIWSALKAAGIHAQPRTDITLLHCVSAYPAPPASMGIDHVRGLRSCFGVPIGLSDHTLSHTASIAATVLGATMIEKHFILDRQEGGPDAAFSIEPHELQELAACVKEASEMMEPTPIEGTSAEDPQRALRRSLHWVRDMEPGDMIGPDSIVSSRPADGIPPKDVNAVLGGVAKVRAKAGDPVRPEQVGHV